jgi:NTP pyrophosphatase (non-canonical NTP hydrolase)
MRTDPASVETQASISRWAEETFGPAGSNARAVARANREMAELLEHVTADDRHPEAAEEIADVVIVLYRVATRLGVDLQGEIDRKMAKNRARRWRLDGTGHGYHVEDDA